MSLTSPGPTPSTLCCREGRAALGPFPLEQLLGSHMLSFPVMGKVTAVSWDPEAPRIANQADPGFHDPCAQCFLLLSDSDSLFYGF